MGKIDEEDEEPQGEEWVIGRLDVRSSITLICVREVDGKPRPDIGGDSWSYDWYRWRSYHAAKKFQRAHSELEGYEIWNLSEIARKDRERKKLFHQRIFEEEKRRRAEEASKGQGQPCETEE